ncbi:MAG: hypothetical protein JNJ54_27550 [Myxococcaceae bacterium]|nr:hypothetical protein [Myxococcaceae bacterium]
MRPFAVVLSALISLACGAPLSPLEAAPPGGGPRLTLNDVSFLLPLPALNREGSLLSMADDGAMGPLLPKRLYDGVPLLVEKVKAEQLYGELRVVSVRIDPCFPGSAPPDAPVCVKQVRLVAQPLTAKDGVLTTRDATVHLFYSLSDAAFAKVTATLFDLDAAAGDLTDGPLDVHPVIRRQGLDGPYHGKLKARLLEVCGLATLTRVAFMAVDEAGVQWRFGAFNVEGGALVDDLIPRLPALKVQAVQEFGTESFRNGALVPAAPNDALDTLLRESEMRFADRRTLDRALTSALRIEHPDRSSPKTVDCASCHVASRARRNAERFHQVDSSGHPDFFAAPGFDLTRLDAVKDEPRALRAFGYFGRDSAFSQRTINESAVVAKALEALRPAN